MNGRGEEERWLNINTSFSSIYYLLQHNSLPPQIMDLIVGVGLRATLNEDPRSRVQWNRAILLDESHKLDPWPLDESTRPKSGKSRLNLHGTILEGKSIGWNPKKTRAKKGNSWFEEPRCKLGSNIGSISRIQFVSNESKLVPTNLKLGPI
jgi:hypothetical protein